MKVFLSIALVVLTLASVGCQSKDSSSSTANTIKSTSSFLVESEPTGAMPVGEARAKSEDGQEGEGGEESAKGEESEEGK